MRDKRHAGRDCERNRPIGRHKEIKRKMETEINCGRKPLPSGKTDSHFQLFRYREIPTETERKGQK